MAVPADRAALDRLVAEASRDVVLVGSPDVPEWISPSVTDVLGYTPQEILEVAPIDLVHPDDVVHVRDAADELAAGRDVGGRLRVRHRDGRYVWLDAHVRALPGVDGTFTGRSLSSWRVVDAEMLALEQLRASEERYRLLVENISDGVALVRHGVFQWVTPNLHRIIGWGPGDWQGRRLTELMGSETEPDVVVARERILNGHDHTMRVWLRGAAGDGHWVEVHARPYADARGVHQGTVCVFRIVDAEVAAEKELEHRARHDQLTGLLNRKEILDRLDAVGRDDRLPGARTAVLFCDLDGFKAINDTHGHAVGDAVLREVAARVSAAVRGDDLVARIGGDELLVVLHRLHGVEEAMAIAEEIRRAASTPLGGPFGPLEVTMSVGVTMVGPGDSADDVVARADRAMYRAKAAGRDGVEQLSSDDPGRPGADTR